MTFQTQVNTVPGVGVAGDPASTNPRVSVVNQAGAFIAGANGCQVGAFGWADAATNTKVSNSGPGAPTGFVGRSQNALITTFLTDNGLTIQPGMGVVLFSEGDFFVKNSGSSACAIGNKAYANNLTGLVTFGPTGNPPSSGTSSASTLAANTSTTGSIAQPSFTATFSGTTMTVSAVGAGAVVPGMVLSGSNLDPATTVIAQLSGTANGAGTYQVNISQSITTGITVTTPLWGVLTIAATITGYFAAGQTISGTGVPSGTTISAQLTGTAGGAGTYAVYASATMPTVSSETITASGGFLTIGGTVTGTFNVNDTITGSSVPAGTYITQGISGTGGAGTYLTSAGATIASEAINASAATETKWYALTANNPGELVKMSTYPPG